MTVTVRGAGMGACWVTVTRAGVGAAVLVSALPPPSADPKTASTTTAATQNHIR